jgi:hypothetical protein
MKPHWESGRKIPPNVSHGEVDETEADSTKD